MTYIVKSTEKNRGIGADYETNEIQKIADFYGLHELKVYGEEL